VPVGVADSADDRIVVGRHRSDPRSSRNRHHTASPTRRVDRARVCEQLRTETLAAFDRIVGLDLTAVALGGSRRKAGSGEGNGPNPTGRGKLGWKCPVAVDRVSIGWTIDGANRNDVRRTRAGRRPAPRSRASSNRCGSGCAGSSKPPTHGGRTTAGSAATPTDVATTATPPSASPPSYWSPASSSPGAPAGARPHTAALRSWVDGGLRDASDPARRQGPATSYSCRSWC
jgi:hypothetical protein